MGDLCYVLMLNGEEVNTGDGTPHFSTEKDAQDFIDRAEHDAADTPPTVRQLDAECPTVSCSACEYTYDEDDLWIVHFESRAEALGVLAGDGWKVSGDEALCPGCVAGEVVGS